MFEFVDVYFGSGGNRQNQNRNMNQQNKGNFNQNRNQGGRGGNASGGPMGPGPMGGGGMGRGGGQQQVSFKNCHGNFFLIFSKTVVEVVLLGGSSVKKLTELYDLTK